MPFNFQFRTVDTRRDLVKLLGFIRNQDLNYPGYQGWVSRTEAELEMGYKTGILVLNNNAVVGDVIWQPHKELPMVREIKNLRIHPNLRRRYFARFLLKQAEAEDRKSYDSLMLDLREDHPEKTPLIHMLLSMGYQKLCAVNLYDSNVRDIIMVKKTA